VFSQEAQPERFDLAGATAVRPDVGGLLPVFVIDRYEGYEVKRLQECTRAELDAWVEANAAAIRQRGPADLLYVNHILLGGAVGAASAAPYVVKAHGSELEYSMRGNAELSAWGGDVLASAAATVVGSEHIRSVVREVCGTVERVHEIPPGVDVELWRPAPRVDALAALLAEARLDPSNPGSASERLPDEGNELRLAEFLEGDRPTVVYYGKLIENKGVQVLLEALRGLGARAVVVGFGDYRDELERMAEGLEILFTGPLEHRHLVHLLALADVAVVPSIFPEAFGMVAAEAAAAGCPPIVANHSGLAEVARGLEEDYPAGRSGLASFPNGDAAALRSRLEEVLALRGDEREALRAAARTAAIERWSWTSVAGRILALVE
jgi:glycosyltransferase involved in cell wall biosynthesis